MEVFVVFFWPRICQILRHSATDIYYAQGCFSNCIFSENADGVWDVEWGRCWERPGDKDWAMTLMALHTLNAGGGGGRAQGWGRITQVVSGGIGAC